MTTATPTTDIALTRYLPHLVVAVSVAVLASAYFFEYVIGLEPCKLCLWQRLPWWIALGIGSLAINYRRRPGLIFGLTLLAAITVLVGAGLGGYHAGVEYKWWSGPSGCTGGGAGPAAELSAALQGLQGDPPAQCDEVPWSLFGISMAGYNFLISLGLGLLVLWALFRKREDS